MIIYSYKEAAKLLNLGKVGLVPTDTIYGISARTDKIESIKRIYTIKGRDFNKPFIILIPNIKSLKQFGVNNDLVVSTVSKHWPTRSTLVFDIVNKEAIDKYEYLHRGKNSLGFRIPDCLKLVKMLEETGPIVSTSANKQNTTPASSIPEANTIFGDSLDFYLDVGTLKGQPSQVYYVTKSGLNKLRG